MRRRKPLQRPRWRSAQSRDKLPLVAQASHPELISRRSYQATPRLDQVKKRPLPAEGEELRARSANRETESKIDTPAEQGVRARVGAHGSRGGTLAISSTSPISVSPAGFMSMITDDLAAVLGKVRRPGDFFAAGTTELLAPLLEIEGLGPWALPLLPIQAKELIGVADPAPYGRGEQTVIDPAVRRCWQIGPDRVHIRGRHWAQTLEMILARVAEGLGVDAPITAEFYKLLLYDEGSFFIGHRDTEKTPGMFATLVVALPSSFAGGELIVRHKGREARLDLRCDDPAEAAFAAFYADCMQEVLPVTKGYRLTLVYNLVRGGRGRPPEPPDYAGEQARVAALLQAWCHAKRRPGDASPEKLVYPLEHAYTPAELGFTALKGADAAVAGVLATAAQQARCDLHLALLTVQESGAAEYSESYGSRRGRWGAEDEFEAGEVLDRYMTLSNWHRSDSS